MAVKHRYPLGRLLTRTTFVPWLPAILPTLPGCLPACLASLSYLFSFSDPGSSLSFRLFYSVHCFPLFPPILSPRAFFRGLPSRTFLLPGPFFLPRAFFFRGFLPGAFFFRGLSTSSRIFLSAINLYYSCFSELMPVCIGR